MRVTRGHQKTEGREARMRGDPTTGGAVIDPYGRGTGLFYTARGQRKSKQHGGQRWLARRLGRSQVRQCCAEITDSSPGNWIHGEWEWARAGRRGQVGPFKPSRSLASFLNSGTALLQGLKMMVMAKLSGTNVEASREDEHVTQSSRSTASSRN